MDTRQELKSLKKALRALTYMNQRGEATVSAVAIAIGVPRPTSYRILETLSSEGYVEKVPHSGLYRITSMVQRLAVGFQDEQLMIERARPMIVALSQELGWPIALSTPRGTDMVVRLNTDHDCAMALDRFHVGFATPMLHSTCGYSYLAHCSEEERDALLDVAVAEERSRPQDPETDESRYLSLTGNVSHLTRFNKNRHDEICYLIDTIRDRGFCNIEFKQYREGNVGVPLFFGGKPVGGIVMRYIKSVLRNTDKIQSHYVPALQKLAGRIADISLSRDEPATAGESRVPAVPAPVRAGKKSAGVAADSRL